MITLPTRPFIDFRLANTKPKQGWNFILAMFLASLSSVHGVRADFWYEDFTDGDPNDSGIDLSFFEDHSISPNGLLLSTPHKFATGAKTGSDWSYEREGWSIRTKGHLLQNHGFFGVATYPLEKNAWAWNAIAASGAAVIGSNFGAGGISDWITTDLRPFDEDVIVQLDTLDGVMRMWAWPAEDPPKEDAAPLIEESFTLPPLARPLIWARSDKGPSSALLSWMAISTEHMPVNMHVPSSDLIGDFSGDDVLDVADIDLLATAIQMGSVHPQYDLNHSGAVDLEDQAYWVSDLKQIWMGDADLDGDVNFADFLALADHFDGPGGWGQGDFDADGTIQFPDFLVLTSNYGRTSTAAAAVPEPCSAVLLIMGVLLRLVTRRVAADS